MSPTPYLVLSAILFTIGGVGVLLRRNALIAFIRNRKQMELRAMTSPPQPITT